MNNNYDAFVDECCEAMLYADPADESATGDAIRLAKQKKYKEARKKLRGVEKQLSAAVRKIKKKNPSKEDFEDFKASAIISELNEVEKVFSEVKNELKPMGDKDVVTGWIRYLLFGKGTLNRLQAALHETGTKIIGRVDFMNEATNNKYKKYLWIRNYSKDALQATNPTVRISIGCCDFYLEYISDMKKLVKLLNGMISKL